MKLTCYMCTAILILLALFGGVYSFFKFNLLWFLCFKNEVIFRSFLAVGFVAALFDIYALFTFRPFKGLK